MKLKAAFNALLQTVYPPNCIFCGEQISVGSVCCADCQKTVQSHPDNRQIVLSDGKLLRCRGLYLYADQVRKAVVQLKFSDRKAYGAAFGKLMAEDTEIREMVQKADLITAVPLSKKRMRERGYSQSALIAQELSRLSNKPYQELVEKHIHNREQSNLKREERMQNVIGVYRVLPKTKLHGETILLVDDVVTTGATLGACAAELYRGGAGLVLAAAFAHTEIT